MIPTRIAYLFTLAITASIFPVQTAFCDDVIQLQFVSFPKLRDAKPVELVIGQGKTMPVELPTNSISKVYKVPRSNKWILGKNIVNTEGKKTFDVYGQSSAISSTKQLIIVIRKGQSNDDGLELITIDNNTDNFGGGKYFLMNATSVDIAGSIGTGKFALRPNSHFILAPKPTKTKDDRHYCYAKIYFRRNEEVQPFFTSTWRFNERARSMVFFYHDPRTSRLRLHTIRDYVQ
ncbi:hypothetical protein JO972_08810 [Verrucomicrobiaceae bacterium 5K15]|uniref:Uncharacterized protein n=1 Tax=Oceaniferula flava TaxID=2800421 RepID=A0AAE2V870_9BACT|nr:hypothetical protein [Oceaniferula flavus]MBK1855057.1 hypothetical protein [Oceaniferula flavus]MBM1136363.1 hypothetical protein [Oceaniferula flavus]